MTSIQQRDAQSVLAGIDDLLPQIRERAQATEDLRRLPEETVAALDQVGFFTLLQPEQWGGLQCDPTLFYEATRRLASACGSTGWVSSIIGVHNWHLALFDQQAQEDVWGDDPKTRISSSYAPMGAGVVVDGGYLVSGSWNWSSGCDHATWAFLGGPVIKDGRPVDFGSFLIPRSEYRIDAAWRQLIGNVGDEYALLTAGKEIPFELRTRARRDQVRATGRSIASIDRLFEASGATALSNDAPIQRFWRDAHAGRVHAANDPERAYVIFGNNEFGLPAGDTMV